MMRSGYQRLGDYIKEVKLKNNNLEATLLLGINIDKFFMPSVANVIGTDMSNYKVVKKQQFACNRMHVGLDYRIPIALSDKEVPFIVSPAYDVFEIIDKTVLLPEYLMMWFSRKEFDRNAWFYTDADVRGGLAWKAFCGMQLPIPSPEKQREIVKEYNAIQNRIKLNNQLISKLEETAQAIYKQWFVDFEFPDENGLPYKSNGGEIIWCEKLGRDVPIGWKIGSLSEIIDVIDGDRGNNYPSSDDMTDTGHCVFLNAGNVTKFGFDFSNVCFISELKDKLLRKGKLKRNDVIITTRGTVGNVAYYSEPISFDHIRINSGMVILREKGIEVSNIIIYSMLRNKDMRILIENYLSGSAQPQLPIRDLIKIPVIIPSNYVLVKFSRSAIKIQTEVDIYKTQNLKLNDFVNLLLSKMTKVGISEVVVI